MTIKVRNGRAEIKLSGTYSAQELRDLIRKLCDAHADLLPSGRGIDNLPRFAFAADRFTVEHAGRGSVRWLVETPTFGWVGAEVPLDAASMFADRIHALIAEQRGSTQAIDSTGPQPIH